MVSHHVHSNGCETHTHLLQFCMEEPFDLIFMRLTHIQQLLRLTGQLIVPYLERDIEKESEGEPMRVCKGVSVCVCVSKIQK